ncbi:MAG: ZPR1 zinc finger domain-containing protein [Candidatus Woesearchaeota archaeon]
MAKKATEKQATPNSLGGQPCPICNKNTLTLTETTTEVPFFGKCYLFSMNCSSCNYHKADVESEEKKDPTRYELEISSEDDMKIRVVRSSEGTIKIPHMITIEAGPNAEGFISNIEGILERVQKIIEQARDSAEDDADKTKAKNMLKKLTRIKWGQEKAKLIIEDPSGNSAIISDKAIKSKIKK